MRPTLVINPRHDHAFAQFTESLVSDGHTTAAGLQAALQNRYPNVKVRARDLEAEKNVVFYVYREGHWTSN